MFERKIHSCVWTLSALLAATLVAGPADAKSTKPAKFGVFTQNVYFGADLMPAVAALAADPTTASDEIATVWDHVQATDFPTRAKRLAKQIANERPSVVGLQEVATWRVDETSDGQYYPPNAATVKYDFVAILLDELKHRGVRYEVAATATNLDFEVTYLPPGATAWRDLRLTDQDVILVRKGVTFTNAQSGSFTAALPLPFGFPLPRGWASVDMTVKGQQFRFVTTHLEDGYEVIQQMQLGELLAGPLATSLPVVVTGDFNTDAATSTAPAVYADVISAGFTDAWAALKPTSTGNTWGRTELLDDPTSALVQRLDYVFTKSGTAATRIELLGEASKDMFRDLWPSDHAGISALISLR